MSETKAYARVNMLVEFTLPAPYGPDWTIGKTQEDAERSALDHAQIKLRDAGMTVVGKPIVQIIILKKE